MSVEQLALPTRSTGRDPPRAQPLGSDVVELILVGIAYFTFAGLGLHLASINPSATPIWPPTGLAIAAILLWAIGLRLPSLLPPF
jgi:integral membrane sensor domain MASE1